MSNPQFWRGEVGCYEGRAAYDSRMKEMVTGMGWPWSKFLRLMNHCLRKEMPCRSVGCIAIHEVDEVLTEAQGDKCRAFPDGERRGCGCWGLCAYPADDS